MRFINWISVHLFVLLLFGVDADSQELQGRFSPFYYPEVLNVHGLPSSPDDEGVYFFSDRGAWHGFGLPSEENPEDYGCFTGPYVMSTSGKWISPALIRFKADVLKGGESIELESAYNPQIRYYPGRLSQKYQFDTYELTLDLIFITDRSSLVRAQIANNGPMAVTLDAQWSGNLFSGNGRFRTTQEGIKYVSEDIPGFGLLYADGESRQNVTKDGYTVSIRNQVILPGEQKQFFLVFTWCYTPAELANDQAFVNMQLAEGDLLFKENTRIWSTYLSKCLSATASPTVGTVYDKLAVKCIETLMTNFRSPAADLHFGGLFPSASYKGFYGFWAWDSWKHAVALARFVPALAKDQIRAMFDYQDSTGMVPDVIYFDKKENNYRNTKPPLAAWAVYAVFEATSDTAFARELLPALLKYHEFWYKFRDHNKNGLCEYGSTDGTLVAAAWESGMDNAVRFDKSLMLQNGPGAWSLNQESVDLNAYLYAEKHYLAALLRIAGDPDMAGRFDKDAEALADAVRSMMYDAQKGCFYDRSLQTGKMMEAEGSECWIPLWAGIATPEQAKAVARKIADTSCFNTLVPFPTLNRSHPDFNPNKGYWRGPVWLDQAYFALKGLERYGLKNEYETLTIKVLKNSKGMLDSSLPVYENYHPLTGEGLNAPNFSWSAAHMLMLLTGER
jgi:putative isomerase